MTAVSARIIGGAGTGKTSELLQIVEKLIDHFGDPMMIGFCSFTRAARKEAVERASARFCVSQETLDRDGWFRTLHSVCYRLLRIGGELLSGKAESKRWINEALGAEVNGTGEELDDDTVSTANERTDEGRAMTLWSFARNRLMPVERVWRHARAIDGHTPDLSTVERVIERYEQAKRLDGRVDFTDLLARFAGVRMATSGPVEVRDEGVPPEIGAWILDEAQDISPLSGRVCSKLFSARSVKYVYLAGDPYQSVYHFCGADHRVFLDWKVAKERISPKSWRCPAPILSIGEKILTRCSDYFDRKISPADHEGGVSFNALLPSIVPDVRPDESWLFLTRANFQTAAVGRLLDHRGTPWHPTKGGGTWLAPERHRACIALMAMEYGQPIPADDWRRVLKYIKLSRESSSSSSSSGLLVRGTKKRFTEMSKRDIEAMGHVPQEQWSSLFGCTEYLLDIIRSKRWRNQESPLIPYADDFYRAYARWGPDAPTETKVRVGTIHSAKGAEADNVVVLLTTTPRCQREASLDIASQDAEHRVWYVAVTRARRRLFVCREDRGEKGIVPEYKI